MTEAPVVARRPLMSLIVLSFNRFDGTTGPCLETLLTQAFSAEAEVVLVDNGSSDGAAQHCAAVVAEHGNWIHWLPLPANVGFAAGMNRGAEHAKGDWLVLVNSDTLFPDGTIAALARTLRAAPDPVALVGPVTNAAGNGQCLPLPGIESPASIARIGAVAMREPTGALLPTYRCDFFCVAIRRQAWEALQGLDERFGLGYYEDFDFSLRARNAGFEMRIAEDVFVVHAGSISFRALGSKQRELMARNKALLKARHPDASFEHQREGNAAVLGALCSLAQQSGWTSALRRRAAWRYAELLRNEPRSPVKRWLWRRKTNALVQRLARAGIHPAFPID